VLQTFVRLCMFPTCNVFVGKCYLILTPTSGISNCWARSHGLQKIAYFNWGSTCRNVWEPL